MTTEMQCAARHERLERLEQLTCGVSRDLQHLSHRVEGLASAHEATIEAVRASTAAVDRLGASIERFDSRMDALATDYATHKDLSSRDRYALPRIAIWLWATSLAALGSLAALVLSEWRSLAALARHLAGQP